MQFGSECHGSWSWWGAFLVKKILAIFHHSHLRISPNIGYTSEKLSISPENPWLVQMFHFLLSPGWFGFFGGKKTNPFILGDFFRGLLNQ